MKAIVKHLLVKREHKKPLVSTNTLSVSPTLGILNSVTSLPFRQVLLLPESTLTEFGLRHGDLRENIVVDGIDIHALPSGTVLRVGSVEIRLTFHCEPCGVIKDKVSPNKILHKRGCLGVFLNEGEISLGDIVKIVDEKKCEPIPYSLGDRILWYINKQTEPILVSDLVHEIGLSNSYCRAVPNIIKNRHDINKSMIKYATKK